MSQSVQEEVTTRGNESSGNDSGNGIGLTPSPPVTGAATRSIGNSERRNGTTPDLTVTGVGARSETSDSDSGNGIGLALSPPVTGAETRSSGNSESRHGTAPNLSVRVVIHGGRTREIRD